MNTDSRPALSIVIPTHNRNPVLLENLRRLSRGVELPDEVIVVDDGSSPAVSDLVRPGDFPFPLTIVRKEKGGGAPAARNTGIRLAKSEVVLLLDDDVWLESYGVHDHKAIHARNSKPGYTVLGRVFFDPDLTRTVLLDYLEEYGPYQWLAKRGERELIVDGIVSANVSIKRAFLEGKELFDEHFPFNRNEDTEFGLRMARQGMEPRYHYGPSARHHSPLTLDGYISVLEKAGTCKGYWALVKPDDTTLCFSFYPYVDAIPVRARVNELGEKMLDLYGRDFAERPVDRVDPCDYLTFTEVADTWFMSVQQSNILEHWKSAVDGVVEAAAFIVSRRDDGRIKDAAGLLKTAYEMAPHFLPLALPWADHLIRVKRPKEALQTLEPFDGIWVNLRRANALRLLGDTRAAADLLVDILMVNSQALVTVRQQYEATGLLHVLSKSGGLEADATEHLTRALAKRPFLKEMLKENVTKRPLGCYASRHSALRAHEPRFIESSERNKRLLAELADLRRSRLGRLSRVAGRLRDRAARFVFRFLPNPNG